MNGFNYRERAAIAGDIAIVGMLSFAFGIGPWALFFAFAVAQLAVAARGWLTQRA